MNAHASPAVAHAAPTLGDYQVAAHAARLALTIERLKATSCHGQHSRQGAGYAQGSSTGVARRSHNLPGTLAS